MAFFDALVERLGGSAGVQSAGLVQTLPMRGGYVLEQRRNETRHTHNKTYC